MAPRRRGVESRIAPHGLLAVLSALPPSHHPDPNGLERLALGPLMTPCADSSVRGSCTGTRTWM